MCNNSKNLKGEREKRERGERERKKREERGRKKRVVIYNGYKIISM